MKNAKRFSCDASLLTVLEDKHSNVLNLGRNSRTVTPKLKLALDIRDETCCFPGCRCKRYVHYHHVKHWSNFGATEPNNLLKLCRHHHALLHEDHYSIEPREQTAGNQQKWIFRTPMGEVIEPSPAFPSNNIESPEMPQNFPKVLKRMLDCQIQKQMNWQRKK